MSCLATIGNLLVWLVIVIAIIAVIRVILAAIFGAPFWPSWPGRGAAPGAATDARIMSVLFAIIDIIFWAAICIGLIWFVIDLFGCLAGGVGLGSPFHR